MSMSLEALGLSQEQVLDMVATKLTEQLMSQFVGFDEDGESLDRPTKFSEQVRAKVEKKVDAAVCKVAEAYLRPALATRLEDFKIPQTNRYGEAQRQPMTFIEYMATRADTYLTEMVDYQGRGRSDGASGTMSTSRVAFMVHQHLDNRIKEEMTRALKAANDRIVEGIEATVKVKLAEVAAALKCEVKTR